MPFKRLRLETVILLASAAYVLHLGATSELDLYIHPRYITFTIALSAIGLLVLAVGASKQRPGDKHVNTSLSLLPLAVILGAALLLPARSLSSATVSQRSIDSGSIATSVNARPLSTLFAGSSRGLKLADWSRIIDANSDPSYYTNKPAKISGFVYDAGLGADTVWLARFIVTCCAVDAQPVGLPVHIQNWQDQYEQDEWLEVEGEFREADTSNGTELVLIPDTTTQIEQPKNPYAN